MVRFKGVLTPTPRGGGTLVPIPKAVAAQLGLKGMPKVSAVIAGTPYRGSLMPMGDGTYCLGVLKSIQEAAGVGYGDSITIDLELDTAPRTVALPADLANAIVHDKKATWSGRRCLTPTRRRWRAWSKRPSAPRRVSGCWRRLSSRFASRFNGHQRAVASELHIPATSSITATPTTSATTVRQVVRVTQPTEDDRRGSCMAA